MGCLSSRCSEHSRSPTSTGVEFEETSFTESEAHARAQMIIDIRHGGQVESTDCLQGLQDIAKRETEMSEIETQLTGPIETTTSELDATQSGAQPRRPTTKSVTLSMAESKDPRYWAQDLKG